MKLFKNMEETKQMTKLRKLKPGLRNRTPTSDVEGNLDLERIL